MKKPMGATCPRDGKDVAGTQRGAEDVVGGVPIAEITSEKHHENGFALGGSEVRGFTKVVAVGVIWIATRTSIAPEIVLAADVVEELVLADFGGRIWAKQRSEVAPTAGGKCFA